MPMLAVICKMYVCLGTERYYRINDICYFVGLGQ